MYKILLSRGLLLGFLTFIVACSDEASQTTEAAAEPSAALEVTESRPNILLIVADDVW